MTKLYKLRLSISIIATAMIVSLSNVLKTYIEPQSTASFVIIMALILFFVNKYGVKILVESLMKSREVRDLINGAHSIEGFWLITTTIRDNDVAINNPAVLEIRFNPVSHEYDVTSIRIDQQGREHNMISKTVLFNIESGEYINDFELTFGSDRIAALAKGQFFSQATSNVRDAYTGEVVTLDKDPIRLFQKGVKISSKKITKVEAVRRLEEVMAQNYSEVLSLETIVEYEKS